MLRLILPGLLLFCLFAACTEQPAPLKPLDLSGYGIPIFIMAPEGANVLEKNYPFMRDITVRADSTFDLQLFELTSETLDAAGEKLNQLSMVKEDPFFKELVREDDAGFIFTKYLDSLHHVDYDFRYVKVLADKEIIFQTGLTGSFNLEEVKRMYKAVR